MATTDRPSAAGMGHTSPCDSYVSSLFPKWRLPTMEQENLKHSVPDSGKLPHLKTRPQPLGTISRLRFLVT